MLIESQITAYRHENMSAFLYFGNDYKEFVRLRFMMDVAYPPVINAMANFHGGISFHPSGPR